MNRTIMLAMCLLLLTSGAFAQSGATPAPGMLVQEQKVKAALKQFIAANDAVEARIEEAVATLAALRDSPESGTKVADMKIKAVSDLKAGVEKYRIKRLKVEDELRRSMSSWDPETLKSVQGYLDAKIQTRVEQIMELVNSINGAPSSGGTKSTVLREDGWGNFREVEDTSSKEYKQGQKMEKRAEQAQQETRKAAEARITDMENRIRTLKTQAAATADSARKAALEQQVVDYEVRLTALRTTLAEIGRVAYEGDVQVVDSASEGHKLSMKLQQLTTQLQAEQSKVDMLGSELMNELAKLDSMKAARKP